MVAKLVIIGILPSTSFILVLRVAVVAIFVILGISPLTSFILVLKVVLVANILSAIILILALYTFCSNYLVHFSIYQYLIYLHQILQNSSITFLAKSDASTSVAFFKSVFVA